MRCASILLKAGAAVTEKQQTIICEALPALGDPKVRGPALKPASWS